MFFFRADCPYREAQAPLLAMLASRYGFTILPVSLDGAPLPGGLFPTFSRDRGQAAHLGVVSTPALFLARPPDDLVPLAQGLLSLAQLEERVVLAAVEAGWISDKDYRRTRPVTADLTLDAAALPSVLPEEPEQLLQVLQALARAGVPAITSGGGER
jgi:conjugal transfer pilus assembly protein TraF